MVIVVCLTLISFHQNSFGEIQQSKASIYNTGIIITNIGDVDQKNGHYWMDFIMFIESENTDFIQNPPSLSFVNGRNIVLSDELYEQGYYEVRVQGEFFNEFDYTLFPFQEIFLKVQVEPKIPNDINYIILEPVDSEPLDKTLKIHGWSIIDSDSYSTIHTYPDGMQFSRFTSGVWLSHEPIGIMLSTILPVTILTAIAMFIFFIPDNFTPRIYLTAPLLLAVVYWHQSNLSHLPVLGYLTLFDKIILVYYALFMNAILSLALQMKTHTLNQDHSLLRQINRRHALFLPIILVGGIFLLWYV